MNILTRRLSESLIVLITAFMFFLPLTMTYADDEQQAPPDPDISDICTLSDCNPARPCADEEQKCYSLNGVFYCCVMPPSGGAQAVGD